MQYDRTPRTGELTCFLAHRGPQLDLRPVGSFARPPPAPRRHSKQPDEEQEDDELCVVIYDLEDGEVGAEDEVEMAEAGGGEVEETEGIREIVVQNLPIPEPMRGPRKRRRPPREECGRKLGGAARRLRPQVQGVLRGGESKGNLRFQRL